MQTAILFHGDTIYRSQGNFPDRSPFSAVVNLIQGIYEKEPLFARKILREKIYADYSISEMDRAMIRVGAKRWAPLDTQKMRSASHHFVDFYPETHQAPTDAFFPILKTPAVFISDPMAHAIELASQVPRCNPRHLSARPIAAILVGSKGELLASAINSNGSNKTLHGEVRLIQNFYRYYQKPIPANARIYVTLKPCRMCAAMIEHAAEDINRLAVYYGEEDTGPWSRNTRLNSIINRLAQ